MVTEGTKRSGSKDGTLKTEKRSKESVKGEKTQETGE